MGGTIDTNARINSQEPASRLDRLAYTINHMQAETTAITRQVVNSQNTASKFQQTTLARIMTTMTEFGQLDNDTE